MEFNPRALGRSWPASLLILASCGGGSVGPSVEGGGGTDPSGSGIVSSAGGQGEGGASTASTGTGNGGQGGSGNGAGGADEGVPDGPLPPYGTRTLQVPANITHFHTGLSVTAGQTVKVKASGTWNVFGTDYGPEGDSAELIDGCPRGSLVGNFGLEWKGGAIDAPQNNICIGADAELVAEKSGIFFLRASFVGGYEHVHKGTLAVTIQSDAAQSPIIPAAQLPKWDLKFVSSDWVELRGAGVYLTVPIELAKKHQGTASAAVAAFDAWYAAEAELSGGKPYGGEPIRLYPDEGISPFAYGLSGNPIRYVNHAMDSDPPAANILRASETGHSAWVWVHEMGHDFTFINAGWLTYMVGGGGVEGWANVPGIYALEKTGFPEGTGRRPHDRAEACADIVPKYVASGGYAQFRDDPWLNLCLVLELVDTHGWKVIKTFLAWHNSRGPGELDAVYGSDEPARWSWLRDRMNEFSGADTTPIFVKYKVPLK